MRYFAKFFLLSVLLLVVGSGLAHAVEIISKIQVIDLGTLPGGSHSTAADINTAGDIVGTSETTSGEEHAFIITGSAMVDIGTLPGGDRSSASGINNLGQVVGTARNSVGVNHGFVWQSGVIRDLGAFPPEDPIGSESGASAINDSGLIAGRVDLAGVVWDLAGVPNFPPFPPFVRVTDPGPFFPAVARDINNAGQAAGTLLFQGSGFRWQGGVLEPLVLLQANDDDAFGINGLGQVVGRGLLAPPVHHHAVLWPDPSTVQDLGTLGGENSEASDLNDAGLVVGFSETGTGATVAFVWRADLGMHSLGTLGGANSKAFGVNASGQIVGESETSTGEVHATLWTITIATKVAIDIKPGSDPNCINSNGHGVIPVAILSSVDFDALTVDPTTVQLDGQAVRVVGKGKLLAHAEDVNGDGLTDLVVQIQDVDGTYSPGDTVAMLTGETFGGAAIAGTDSICVVP
jgi:probable HAF family extracellular repeat protein